MSTREELSWQAYAACAGRGDLMYPHDKQEGDIEAAKQICSGCKVRAQCLDSALRSGDFLGVQGGMTGEERRQHKRRTDRRARSKAA